MEIQLFPYKAILYLGLLVIVFDSIYAFDAFYKKDTGVICNEKTGITVLLKSKESKYTVLSKSNPKDTLSCVGKMIPFYSRSIDRLIASNSYTEEVLRKRYIVDLKSEPREELNIEKFDDIYYIHLEKKLVIVAINKNVSPFMLTKYISKEIPFIVYKPENSPKIDELTQKLVHSKGGMFRPLKLGEKVDISLF